MKGMGGQGGERGEERASREPGRTPGSTLWGPRRLVPTVGRQAGMLPTAGTFEPRCRNLCTGSRGAPEGLLVIPVPAWPLTQTTSL